MSDQLTFLSEAPPANRSRSQERIAAVDGLAAACADQWGTPGNLGQNTNQEQNQ
jgi:hypothetical protein